MRVTIDPAGRVVIPKAMRQRLGLIGHQDVEIRERDGAIELEPAATPMTLEERGGQVVAVPGVELPPLTDNVVRATLDKTRR